MPVYLIATTSGWQNNNTFKDEVKKYQNKDIYVRIAGMINRLYKVNIKDNDVHLELINNLGSQKYIIDNMFEILSETNKCIEYSVSQTQMEALKKTTINVSNENKIIVNQNQGHGHENDNNNKNVNGNGNGNKIKI